MRIYLEYVTVDHGHRSVCEITEKAAVELDLGSPYYEEFTEYQLGYNKKSPRLMNKGAYKIGQGIWVYKHDLTLG